MGFPRRRAPAIPPDAFELATLLWAIQHQLKRTSKLMQRQLGITGPQRLVLRIIERDPGISSTQLASLAHLHKSTLTGIVGRLERRAFVSRRADRADRRRARLHVRAPGRTALASGSPTLESVIAEVASRVPRRRLRAAVAVLSRVCAAMARQADRMRAPAGRAARMV